jgi:hypothetical protein
MVPARPARITAGSGTAARPSDAARFEKDFAMSKRKYLRASRASGSLKRKIDRIIRSGEKRARESLPSWARHQLFDAQRRRIGVGIREL